MHYTLARGRFVCHDLFKIHLEFYSEVNTKEKKTKTYILTGQRFAHTLEDYMLNISVHQTSSELILQSPCIFHSASSIKDGVVTQNKTYGCRSD